MIYSRKPKLRTSFWKIFLIIALLLSGCWLADRLAYSSAQQRPPLLTKADDVRRLSANQAALGYPVRLQGFVIYFDPDMPNLYMQDQSCGIYVELEQPDPSLKPGQKVEAEGIGARGNILPIATKARVKSLEGKGFPRLRKVLMAQCGWTKLSSSGSQYCRFGLRSPTRERLLPISSPGAAQRQ